MRTTVNRFIFSVILLTAVCAVIEKIWNTYMPEPLTMKSGYLLLGIFALSVSVLHLLLIQSAKGSPQVFIRFFMVGTAFKMLFLLLVLIVYLMFFDENKKALVLHFLFYYAAYTILEVSMLYRDLQKRK